MNECTWSISYDGTNFETEEELGGWLPVRTDEVKLLRVDTTDGRQYTVKIEEGMRPIFFRRITQSVNFFKNTQEVITRIPVFGWQKTVEGRNVKSLIWLLPDGGILVTDRD